MSYPRLLDLVPTPVHSPFVYLLSNVAEPLLPPCIVRREDSCHEEYRSL